MRARQNVDGGALIAIVKRQSEHPVLTVQQRVVTAPTVDPDAIQASGPGGLAIAPFRDGTPYQGEDLLYDPSAPDRFFVRCNRSRGELTLATCLYERPDGAAALTFRFPRDWLDDWPSVLGATDRLIAGWQPGGG